MTLVEAGKIRSCLRSVLTKNIVDVSLCTVCWWALGHGLSKGLMSNSFIAVGRPFILPSNSINKVAVPWCGGSTAQPDGTVYRRPLRTGDVD